jgi:hypothetical protein
MPKSELIQELADMLTQSGMDKKLKEAKLAIILREM